MRWIREVYTTLVTSGDPLLSMLVAFCGTFSILMIAAMIFAFIYTA